MTAVTIRRLGTGRFGLRFSVLLATMLGCACSLIETPPAARLWLLDINIPTSATSQASSDRQLTVLFPKLSAPYDQDRVWLAEGGELSAIKGVRWHADVPSMLKDVAIEALRASKRFSAVRDEGQLGAWQLQLSSTRFRAERAGTNYLVQLTLAWELSCLSERRLERSGVVQGRAQSSSAAQLRTTFVEATQQALTELIGAFEPIELDHCQA
jgi:ABC-type uncharacterized transport system auxiliary subunit